MHGPGSPSCLAALVPWCFEAQGADLGIGSEAVHKSGCPRLEPKLEMSYLTAHTALVAAEQPLKHTDCHSDVESTVAAEQSDIETEEACPSELPSPRSSDPTDACEDNEGQCNVVVRSTFIDVDDGRSLMQRYRQLRRAMTDSVSLGAFNFAEEEIYEAGRFSDDCAKEQEAPGDRSPPSH